MRLREIWRYSKREWILWWPARTLCIFGWHTSYCLGRCDPERGHWIRRW